MAKSDAVVVKVVLDAGDLFERIDALLDRMDLRERGTVQAVDGWDSQQSELLDYLDQSLNVQSKGDMKRLIGLLKSEAEKCSAWTTSDIDTLTIKVKDEA